MIETTLCGYCVDLHEKGRAAAAQVNRCPLCKTELGVSAAGQRFRIGDDEPPPRRSLLAGFALAGAATGLAVLTWIALPSNAPPETFVLPAPPTPVVDEPRIAAEPPPPADVAAVKRYAEGVRSPDARAKPQVGPLVPMPSRAEVVIAPTAAKAECELPADTTKHLGRVDGALWRKVPSLPALASAELRIEYDLLTTPEVGLAQVAPRRASEFKSHSTEWRQERTEARVRLQELEKKIHQKNGAEPDGFIRTLAKDQTELAGLPFRLGKACQLQGGEPAALAAASREIRTALTRSRQDAPTVNKQRFADEPPNPSIFWAELGRPRSGAAGNVLRGNAPRAASLLPGLMQILGTEQPELRLGLIGQFRDFKGAHVTTALVRLALFDPAAPVRDDALHALKERPASEYTDLLLESLRYPWAPVAHRAAGALVFLECTDLGPALTERLGQPDPCDPFEQEINGKKTLVVREMVKINHHRNCLLCHAPLQTNASAPAAVTRTERRSLPLGLVPSLADPLPPFSSGAYYAERRGETVVRADVTYLRQDFSMLLPVEDPAPWPALQRFDFIVRTRVLTADELQAARHTQQARPLHYQSPHRRAILSALHGLAQLDARAKGNAN